MNSIAEILAKKYANSHQDVSGELGKYLVESIFIDGYNTGINYSKNLSLYCLGDSIYSVVSSDSQLLAMTFLRPQEYYESRFPEIFRTQFKISNFNEIYMEWTGKDKFTYCEDWGGYNLPSNILEECMFNLDQSDINYYDEIMFFLIKTIKMREGNKPYYLIGVDSLTGNVLEHEFAHGMYHTVPEYKTKMDALTANLPPHVKNGMLKGLSAYGYVDDVIDDEIQAFISTGLAYEMVELKIRGINKEMKKYKQVFKEYYEKHFYKQSIKIL